MPKGCLLAYCVVFFAAAGAGLLGIPFYLFVRPIWVAVLWHFGALALYAVCVRASRSHNTIEPALVVGILCWSTALLIRAVQNSLTAAQPAEVG
jgi:hypothetical protein